MQRHVLFGPPGTGKTTALLRQVETYLAQGIPPERIGFVSFSRRAIAEARSRLPAGDYPHFRTIHSLAYRQLGLSRSDVMDRELLRQFQRESGFAFRCVTDPLWEGGVGDVCLALHHLAQARGTDARLEWDRAGEVVRDVTREQAHRMAVLYETFKQRQHVVDFGDMIRQAQGTLDVDVLMVDEAQDTSWAQWRFLQRVASHVPRVHFAGDDDQAVYEWSGADPDQLLRWQGQREVLPVSYRLPAAVKRCADGIARRIQRRVPKLWSPRQEEGAVRWASDPSHVDLRTGTWLLLARHNHQLRQWRELARSQGVVYTMQDGGWSWSHPSIRAAIVYERLRRGVGVPRNEARVMSPYLDRGLPAGLPDTVTWDQLWPQRDRSQTWMDGLPRLSDSEKAYLRALRRSGESLTKPGRVRIATVHSAKGAEAESVALLTDVSRRVFDAMARHPDPEYRVQYVAVTRARQQLVLVRPQGPHHWGLAR